MAVLLISEVLFFVLNKFGRDPVDQIKKIVADFFTVADVREAKELLRAELVRILCPHRQRIIFGLVYATQQVF